MATEEGHFATEPKRPASLAQIGLIVAVLVALLAVLFFFLLNGLVGAGAHPQPTTPTVEAAPGPEDESVGQAQPEEGEERAGRPSNKAPVETFEVFASRDPFEPLVDEGGGSSEEGGKDGDETGTASRDKEANTSAQVGGHTITAVSVSAPNESAQIRVDGTVYTVSEGRRFAQNFELVSTSGECAELLYGDDQFTLCEGEQILK